MSENRFPKVQDAKNRNKLAIVVFVTLVVLGTLTALFAGLFQKISIVLYVCLPVLLVLIYLSFYVICISQKERAEDAIPETLGGNASVPGSMGYIAMLVTFSSIGWITIALAWCVSVIYDTDGCKDEPRTRVIFSMASFGGFSIFLTGIFPNESTKLRFSKDKNFKEVKANKVVFQFVFKKDKYYLMSACFSTVVHYFSLFMYVGLMTICLGLTTDWVGDHREAMGYTFVAVNSFLVLLFPTLWIVRRAVYEKKQLNDWKLLDLAILLSQYFMVFFTLCFWCIHALMRINFLTEVMSCARCSSETFLECDVGCFDNLNTVEFQKECPHCEDEFNCDLRF